MSVGQSVEAVSFDERWHREIDEMVKGHDEAIRGNGEPGLKEIVRNLVTYENGRKSREEQEAADKKSARTQYRVAAFAGVLALAGLLVMSVLDHTVWKKEPVIVPVAVTTTTTTDKNTDKTTDKTTTSIAK